MKLSIRLAILLISLLLQPSGLLAAAELAGTVLQTAGPYLLLQTAAGERVVRTDDWTAWGNLEGAGSLKYGGEIVTVSYELETAGVPKALIVSRETEYTTNHELLLSVEQLAAGLSSGTMLLLDSRSRQEWEEAHLPGALLHQAAIDLQHFQGQDKVIVLYGSSAADLRPFQSARRLAATDYKNIRIFAGGVKAWRSQGRGVYAAPAHLAALLEGGEAFRLVDLRPPLPVQTPLMNGAEALPLASWIRSALFLPARAYQLPLYLYGEESELQAAARLLAEWGFHHDGDFALLDPSWKGWVGKYSVAKHKPGALPSNEIPIEAFRVLWTGNEKSSAVLLNVKPKRDREIAGEIHIPLEELPERLGELPRDREIIIYCSVGLRSAIAQRILQMNGFSSRFVNSILRFDKDKNPVADQP